MLGFTFYTLPFFVFFVVYNASFHAVSGKYVEGTLKTMENWAFVARFCFLSEEGQFEYIIEYDKEYGTQNILLYFDIDTQWPAVYKSNKTCEQREQVLVQGKNQIIRLNSAATFGAGCEVRNRTDEPVKQVYVCHSIRKFRSARERWWFIAVSNCNTTKGLSIKYKFLMTNGAPGDYWREHFSADEFYILPILMAMSLIYLLMIIAIVMCTVELKSRQLLHSTYKMFVYSVAFQELGILFQSISFIRYAVDGSGFPTTKNFGRLLESVSEIIYLLLLLLLAKGYTVTRGRLRLASSVKLTIFMCVYVITYMALFWYETQFFDPGLVLYMYESPPGYGLLGLRLIAWWMFVFSTIFTLKHYPEKAKFYYSFNIIGTLWFVAGPSFILAANGLIDKWVRESIVYAALHLIAFLGHILFLTLTLPSRANKNFPFHVRTSQIACLDANLNNIDPDSSFVHHAYAPSSNNQGVHRPMLADWITDHVPVELFSISRNIQMSYIARPPLGMIPLPPPGHSMGETNGAPQLIPLRAIEDNPSHRLAITAGLGEDRPFSQTLKRDMYSRGPTSGPRRTSQSHEFNDNRRTESRPYSQGRNLQSQGRDLNSSGGWQSRNDLNSRDGNRPYTQERNLHSSGDGLRFESRNDLHSRNGNRPFTQERNLHSSGDVLKLPQSRNDLNSQDGNRPFTEDRNLHSSGGAQSRNDLQSRGGNRRFSQGHGLASGDILENRPYTQETGVNSDNDNLMSDDNRSDSDGRVMKSMKSRDNLLETPEEEENHRRPQSRSGGDYLNYRRNSTPADDRDYAQISRPNTGEDYDAIARHRRLQLPVSHNLNGLSRPNSAHPAKFLGGGVDKPTFKSLHLRQSLHNEDQRGRVPTDLFRAPSQMVQVHKEQGLE